jgi:hypothetical protein
MASVNAPRRQRSIQEQVAKADKARPKEEPKKAMQTGAREYPSPPFPKQHQSKPGSETDLDPYTMLLFTGARANLRKRSRSSRAEIPVSGAQLRSSLRVKVPMWLWPT